jgi:hypothetical protein
MRPQLAPLVKDEAELAALADEQLEDLGWNDMGSDGSGENAKGGGADVVPIKPPLAADETDAESLPAHNPSVRRQQRRLEERVLADAVMTGPETDMTDAFDAFEQDDEDYANADEATAAPAEPFVLHEDPAPEQDAAPAPAPPPAPRASKTERRAAFTLRLDPERHLKLRLAATMQGVSAQTLVTEALDQLLAEFDDLDIIAAHLKRH